MTEKKQAEIMDAVEPEETDIVVAPDSGSAVALPESQDAFLQDSAAEDDDSTIPILKLIQKDEHAGEFYCEDMDLAFPDGMKVVLLKMQNSCILWPEKYSKDSEPLCKSDDGISPSEGIESPMCAEPECCKAVFNKQTRHMEKPCEYGNWAEDTPPRCKDTINLLLLEVGEESYIPYWYSVKSTALSPFKKFRKTMGLRKRALTAKRKRAGMAPAHSCMFTFKLSTELKQNDAGDAYIPVFSDIEEIDTDEANDVMVPIAMEVQDIKLAHAVDDAAKDATPAEKKDF
jgi:hypothetical protein